MAFHDTEQYTTERKLPLHSQFFHLHPRVVKITASAEVAQSIRCERIRRRSSRHAGRPPSVRHRNHLLPHSIYDLRPDLQ